MANLKHGMSQTSVYDIWAGMVARCHRVNDSEHYRRYGARGITVCDRWRYSFENFYADMGDRPPEMTLERKNNDLGYSPENCVWATRKTQQRNRRGVRFLTIDGVTKPLVEWAELRGVPAKLLADRVFTRGWDHERALNEPAGSAPNGPRNPHGLPGVLISGKKWGAVITHKGQRIWVGTFDTKEAAYTAREEKYRALLKERG